ncbi:MAG: MFS transporter [Thermotogae bacterium]|nr:MFS transporter [Thermotogota bacterium]
MIGDQEREHKRSILLSIFEGGAYTGFFLISQGFFLTSLALYFRLSELALSIVFAIPSAVQLLQLFTPFVIDKVRSRKKIVIFSSICSRLPWAILLALVLMKFRTPSLFILLFAASQVALTFAGNAWNSWIKDLVPDETRGRYFGIRNLFSGTITILLTYVYSQALDGFPAPYNHAAIITLALIFGSVSILLLSRQYEPPHKFFGALAGLGACLKDERFRKFLLFTFVWNSCVYFSAPYFSLYQIEFLKLPYTRIGFYAIIIGVVSIPAYYFWGILTDRFGAKTITYMGIATVAVLPGLWVFMAPSNMYRLLLVDALIAGVGWAAINLALYSLAFEVAGFNSAAYFSLFYASTSLGSMAGSVAGGMLGKVLINSNFRIFGCEFEGIKFIFLLAFFMRLSVLYLLGKVEPVRYFKPRMVLGTVLTVVGRRLATLPRDSAQYLSRRLLRRKERKNSKR